MRAEMLLFTCKGLMATQELNPGSLLLGGCFIWHQQGCWKTQVSLGDSKTHLRAISPAAWGLSLDPLVTEAGEFLPLRVWGPLWCAGKSILGMYETCGMFMGGTKGIAKGCIKVIEGGRCAENCRGKGIKYVNRLLCALCLIPTVGVCTGGVCVWAGQTTSNWTQVAAWGCLSPSASSKRDWDPGAATGHMHIYIYIFSTNRLSSQSAREGNRIRPLELCLCKCCVFCLCGQPCTYVDTSMYICIYVHMYSVRVCVPVGCTCSDLLLPGPMKLWQPCLKWATGSGSISQVESKPWAVNLRIQEKYESLHREE